MTILVTYGSKRGGTRELATWVANDLRDEGCKVDLLAPKAVNGLEDYEAVVVGGALYAFRWHRTARRFVKRHRRELRQMPTWLFSSGPLDDSATEKEIPPVNSVQRLMEQVGAKGHVTFGGRMSPDAKGFPASAMAKKNPGDWRNPDQVREWAHSIATELRANTAQLA